MELTDTNLTRNLETNQLIPLFLLFGCFGCPACLQTKQTKKIHCLFSQSLFSFVCGRKSSGGNTHENVWLAPADSVAGRFSPIAAGYKTEEMIDCREKV